MAAILSAEHLSKSYTLKKLLTDVTIYVGEHDRIGVVGVNGTGKSTLLKLLSGLDEPDGGVVMRKNGLRVSYLPQMPDYSQPRTAVQQVLFDAPKDVGAPDEYEAKALLSQFGIDDFDADVRTLSGGQKKRVALAADADPEDLLTCDLYLYNPQPGVEWDGLIAAPRLDDLQCAFSCVTAFIRSGEDDDRAGCAMPVLCLFDNEEVGSQTRQGAASTFLSDVLVRVAAERGLTREEYLMRLASSFMLSCDNGHAIHPNHPEFADKNHAVTLGGGVVIKYNASQRYTSDAVTAGLFRLICDEADVPVQVYTNRADMPGGSTLGNISGTQVSVPTVDIGLAQLAMHASYETAGAADTAYMVQALTAFFRRSLTMSGDGCYALL